MSNFVGFKWLSSDNYDCGGSCWLDLRLNSWGLPVESANNYIILL